MAMLGIVLGVLLLCFTAHGFINTGDMQYSIRMNVFSGRSNPSWTVDKRHPLYTVLAWRINRARPTRQSGNLGYDGFSIEIRNLFGERAYKTIGAGTNPSLEMLLMKSSPRPIEPLVRRHVIRSIRGRRVYPSTKIYQMRRPFRRPIPMYSFCKHPRFDPENWNVPPVIFRNNCYNYATQRQTGTFAQPGRASGRRFSRPINAPNVLSATLRDGLIWLPFFSPKAFPQFCYIALSIWPGVDYHFYRLDSNKLWSHKPGRTPAKNRDNSGNLITDPRTADRGNYVVFAGYLGNNPEVRVL